ncbi:MAG TPA: hypothetical protein V6D35_19325 [Candidatus Sericytochromatia bacterium]
MFIAMKRSPATHQYLRERWLQHLYQLLENWQPDLEAYREIVERRFLGQEAEQLLSVA